MFSTYPHIYNSPKLLISREQTQPELGHKTSSVNGLDLRCISGIMHFSDTQVCHCTTTHINLCTNL